MPTQIDEPEIREVRAARQAISRACGNDPWKLVAFMENFRLDAESPATKRPRPVPGKPLARAPRKQRSA